MGRAGQRAKGAAVRSGLSANVPIVVIDRQGEQIQNCVMWSPKPLLTFSMNPLACLLLVNCTPSDVEREGMPEEGANYVSEAQQIMGDDLERMFSGKTISNRDIPNPNFVTFGERFDKDGAWSASFQTRAPTQLQGHWRIVEDQMCVAIDNEPEVCRTVRFVQQPDVFAIASILPNSDVKLVKFKIF